MTEESRVEVQKANRDGCLKKSILGAMSLNFYQHKINTPSPSSRCHVSMSHVFYKAMYLSLLVSTTIDSELNW